MKLLTRIFILSFLLTVFSSTSSNSIKGVKEEALHEEPSLYFPILAVDVQKEVKELREVKYLLTETQEELSELKQLLEEKKLKDSILIYHYVNK